jgi:iron complex outermembrane recepter protein
LISNPTKTIGVAVSLYAVTLFFFVLMGTVAGYASDSGEAPLPGTGILTGKIIDYETSEPVGWTSVLIVETSRSVSAHEDGTFLFTNVPAGTYTLRTHRIGYETVSRQVTITSGDTTRVNFRLRKTVFRSRSIEVVGARENGNDVIEAEMRIDGRELRQQLGRTLAETLQNEPGMAQSSMGPAPARPVLRGLSGDRLQVLEDGRTTGDISTSSPDHAIAIDPINSEYIEILRGPAALVYTSNSLAGVVNVVRRQIPTELPSHFHGSASVQGETVNEGISSGFSAYGSAGNYGLKGDLGLRTANDINTPEGRLDNTSIQNIHGGLGVSRIERWGLIGISGNIFRLTYGVPGNFEGSHPEGVIVNLEREQFDARFDYFHTDSWLNRTRIDYTFSHYYHDEVEYSPERQAHDIVGSEYSLFKNTLTAKFYHDKLGWADKGIFGLYAQTSNFTAGGFTFTPTTNDYSFAAYTYQDFRPSKEWSIQAGIRFDTHIIVPVEEVETSIGLRRKRNFANFSGGIKADYQITEAFSTGASIMRTVRMPGVEELFSEGPHLPAYSYEVGNPDLNEEAGTGAEISFRFAKERFRVKNSWYMHRFSNYLYPQNTGEESVRRPLPIYQYRGAPVQMVGTELQVEVNLLSDLMFTGTVSYVEGNLTEEDSPLPFMPPLSGKSDLQYAFKNFTIGTSVRFAADQNRLGEFEEPTDGYTVLDAFAQYYISDGRRLHTFSLTAENITNETYRMHLSRVKVIMPEAGRNIKLLYRFYF